MQTTLSEYFIESKWADILVFAGFRSQNRAAKTRMQGNCWLTNSYV